MRLIKSNNNLCILASLMFDKDHKSVTGISHTFSQTYKTVPLPSKICLHHVWNFTSVPRWRFTEIVPDFLVMLLKATSLPSQYVYCLKINSVDRKPMWDKHDPYVLLLHFRRVNILMWLHAAHWQWFSLAMPSSFSWGRKEIGWTEHGY